MTSGLSRSGARIRGDDYQHLFSWSLVLQAILGHGGIAELGIEDPDAGNADDVTVYKYNGECEFFQVKSSVDAREPISTEWLMKPSKSGGASIIQRFHSLWACAPSEYKLKLELVSNRLPKDGDPVLSKMDGRDTTVARGLKLARPRSESGKARSRLAEHLQVSDNDLIAFLGNLRFNLGWRDDEWIKWVVVPHMYAAGLRHDEVAILQGIAIVRGWVTEGKRKLTIDELHQAVAPLKRPDDLPAASLLIQAIDHDPMPDSATIVLDWTDQFPGEGPKTRRLPVDQASWNGQFRSDLHMAKQSLRAQNQTNVLVRGHMRLPTWFAVGVALNRTADFQVASFQGVKPWSSEGELAEIPIESCTVELGAGQDLAIGIALAADPSTDVLRFLRGTQSDVGQYICIHPENGTSNQAIRNAAEARGWAYNVRDRIRQIGQEYNPLKIHLFLAGPHGAILLLGHLWDRMPTTQLYEDLASNDGYSPSFLIRN